MPFDRRPRFSWQLRNRTLALGERTLLMGIVNITPDSFADGGRHFARTGAPEAAVAHALQLLAEGADILDLGAESTRPGAVPLVAAEEQDRLLPVLETLRRESPGTLLSVDTYHASTAREAMRAGADIINDVSGLSWDPEMAATVALHRPPPGLVLMHTRGRPSQWQTLPPLPLKTVTLLVREGLEDALTRALAHGIARSSIVLDPGFGFGKLGGPENFTLLSELTSLHALGVPLLVGLSRKGFLQASLHGPNAPASEARLHATLAANTAAIFAGAHILRVHDVASAREAAAVADALLLAPPAL